MELARVKAIARKIGFDAVGVAPAALLSEDAEWVARWVAEGRHAGMRYMERNREVREDVGRLVEGARSVVVTLTNYYHPWQQPEGVPRIAMYARGRDYHSVVKERLRALLTEMQALESGVAGRCFTDSAPLLEHAWARRAGLGWQGKNTLLIRKGLGSFCFIGVVVTTAVFDAYDEPFEENFCGTCTRCVEACPTGALSVIQSGVERKGVLDARKCLSYHTIENKGEFPEELKRLAGGRIFGCDACQTVCPWNARLTAHTVPDFLPCGNNMTLTAAEWLAMGEEEFRERFRDTPLERAGMEGVRKHVSL